MTLKNIPQAERLLSGTLTSYLSDVATTCVMSDPPSKFPTYIDLEPDSTTKKELIRAVAVSGSTVTIERSVNGVVTDHAANATYKQKITSRHWDAVSDALEKGYLMEDALRALIRVSDTQFTITGYGASDDLTGTYTIGRVLRINSSASYVMTVTSSSYSAGTNKTTIDVSATLPTPVSTVEFGIAPEGGTDLPLVSKTLTTPKIVTSINDANGNEVIKTPATTSAVNEVTVTNSATGNAVQLSATGGDTNIDLKLAGKGTGIVSVGTDEIVTLTNTKTLTNKTLTSPTLQGTLDGWISANESWAYASASTITVPTGAAAKYVKGDKIKLTQTTVKYFYVVGVADTVLTVVGETSAIVVANAAISLNYYSHENRPVGFPTYFSWTPTLTAGSADLSGFDSAFYSIEGCRLSLFFNASNRSLSGTSGTIIVSCPVAVAVGNSGQWGSYTYYISSYAYARCILDSNGMNLQKGMTSETWVANETGVYINISGYYWI